MEILFEGTLNSSMRGFYISTSHHAGQENLIATTQFEATDARRAFPCFDEPGMKAVFEVTLIVKKSHTAISNTIESKITQLAGGYKSVKFKATPKMSTYLLAFIVGDFQSVQGKTKDGTKIRIFAPKGKVGKSKFALETAKRTLEFLNEYFGIKYPLPVLDLVAVPDFTAGAMENWGAVIFRETTLLVDEEHTPFLNRQQVAEVIAHELVHQWFGNLVTMEWWTHLWLNESFAHYMSHYTVNALFPEWNYWTKFVLSEQSKGLNLDSLHNTHPVESEIKHPDDIDQIFDAISYSKGASLLRMLANFLGDETFRDGLRHYLKKHAYKNTTSTDLWNSFGKVSNKPVRKIMENWITKPGYPLVKASISGNKVRYEQTRFTLLNEKPRKAKDNWIVPLQSQNKKSEISEMFLLKSSSNETSIHSDFEYIKLNPGEQGFYRTLYDRNLLARLLLAMQENKLSAIDQLGIIRDLSEAAKAGFITTDVVLEAIRYVTDRTSFIVWMQISKIISEIESVFGESPQLQKYSAGIFLPLMESLGIESKSHDTTSKILLRSLALTNSAKYGNQKAIKYAKQSFAKHLSGKFIEPDMRSAIYFVTAKYGGKKEWAKFRELYIKADMQEEKRRLGNALFSFESESLLNQSIEFLFSKEVRAQDFPFMFKAGMSNGKARQLVWKAFQSRFNEIMNMIPKGNLMSFVVNCLGALPDEKDYRQLVKFFGSHKIQGSAKAVEQVKEAIKIKYLWQKRDRQILARYLRS